MWTSTLNSGSPTEECPFPTMPLPTDWLLRHSVVMCLLLHSLVLMTFCFHHAATTCSNQCYCSESETGGKTVRCSNLQLTEIPLDIPNDTQRIYLDFNLLTSVPTNAFGGLSHLVELDISHNELTQLEPGAFRGLGPSLQFLDLSSNKLVNFNPEAFDGLRAYANLTNNPWHCDCNLQMAMPRVDLEPVSLTGIVCQTSDPEEIGVEGHSFLLKPDIDLCVVMKKTTDVAMLVVMFGWFTMVISYLVYYVRANQEDARRHLEYLKSLPSRQGRSEESSTISTVV
ncbi:Leucine-rich repeat-containing protein 3B [Oryzias melastigma]|uniref:Leucine-rich repeat-containing protein 3B n=1 Tax=Oryzias melastigma TaxID=30732 RepID=A0A834FBS8_ORYME|nr:Leucine-rich repeat-containing protein 3B [Oryzias melastigma]